MKALSMTQPWAQALFIGLKHYETRSWSTNYRGPLLIHAAKHWRKPDKDFAQTERALGRFTAHRIPFGAIIGKVDLVNVCPVEEMLGVITGLERLYGDYSPGRYAWELANPVLFPEPIPYRGALRLFNVDDSIPNKADIPERIAQGGKNDRSEIESMG